MNKNQIAIVHSPEYEGWVFSDSHPTQGRRFTKAYSQLTEILNQAKVEFQEFAPREATIAELELVHSSDYLAQVLEDFQCGEWEGERSDLAHLAQLFAGGTLVALEALLSQSVKTAVHFPGAKHHAQRDHSSGFCVFADFALAAEMATKRHGLKVAIYDFDGHHGDGTENLTADNPDVLTFSIHEYGIFPGTGRESIPEKHIINLPLSEGLIDSTLGMGDEALEFGVESFINECRTFGPDLIFIAAGADGEINDPLTSLEYSEDAMVNQGLVLRSAFPDIPMLVGGAGGYQPDTVTPRVWAKFASLIAGVNPDRRDES
jgi:acetoin utilization protein AcuC